MSEGTLRKTTGIVGSWLATAIFVIAGLNGLAWTIGTLATHWSSRRDAQAIASAFPDLSVGDLAGLVRDTRDLQWRYDPWVQFRETPGSRRMVTILPSGARSNGRPCTHPRLLYVFGGSTTFGHGVRDHETIPAQLEVRLPGWCVVNFGQRNYWSDQETALFWRLVQEGHRPHGVLFIDGLNEGQREPQYTTAIREMIERPWGFLLATVNAPLLRLVRRVVPPPLEDRHFSEDDADEVARRWVTNRAVARVLGQQIQAGVFHVIQPIPGYRNHWGVPGRMIQFSAEKMRRLETLADDRTWLLTDRLEREATRPFVDAAHYTTMVSAKLSAEIAKKLGPVLQ